MLWLVIEGDTITVMRHRLMRRGSRDNDMREANRGYFSKLHEEDFVIRLKLWDAIQQAI